MSSTNNKKFYNSLVKKMQINEGDIVYLASDLIKIILYFKIKKRLFDPNDLINSLLDVIGKNGTLIIPSFNWDFCKKKPYDIINSRAQTGSLANFVLKNRVDFSRTTHPIYSFLVTGRYKETLISYNNVCGFNYDSPFDFFYKKNIKLVSLGTPPSESFSIIHYFEQKVNVEYRFVKKFKSKYKDKNGKNSLKTYSAFVRKLKYKKRRDYDISFWNELERRKVLFISEYKNIPLSMLTAKKAGNIILKDLLSLRKYYPEKIKQNI